MLAAKYFKACKPYFHFGSLNVCGTYVSYKRCSATGKQLNHTSRNLHQFHSSWAKLYCYCTFHLEDNPKSGRLTEMNIIIIVELRTR